MSKFRLCFTLFLFIILLVHFGLLSGHLLGNSCPLGSQFVFTIFCLFVIFIYFPVLVLRAGFTFYLLQFLFIAFLLLSSLKVASVAEQANLKRTGLNTPSPTTDFSCQGNYNFTLTKAEELLHEVKLFYEKSSSF